MNNSIAEITSPKRRELLFDTIRGVLILLVVYGHVSGFIFEGTSKFDQILSTTAMPLFFFISGFFIYSIDYNGELLWRRFKNRISKHLYPTVVFFALFVVIFKGGDFLHTIYDQSKAGYWFTYVSVLYFITLAPILWIFSRFKIKNFSRILILLALVLLAYGLHFLASYFNFNGTSFGTLFSSARYLGYLPFLMFGSIFRILWEKYSDKLINHIGFVISLLGFVVCYVYGKPLSYLCAYFGIYIFLYVFQKLCKFWSNSRILNFFSFIGTLTLEIYLLHYFVIKWARDNRGGVFAVKVL